MDVDLEFVPDICYEGQSPLAPHNWPFEIFIYFVRFLDATDLLNLRLLNGRMRAYATNRSSWRTLAEEIIKVRPIPLDVAQTVSSLTSLDEQADATLTFSLIKAITTAFRVHRNWDIRPQPILRKILVFQPGALKRAVDIAALLNPGSRYLISTEFVEDERKNRLTISDILMQTSLGSWSSNENHRLISYRSVENGAAIMFLMHPGVIGPDNLVEYELIRFEFPTSSDQMQGRFASHSFFRQATALSDLSLSEDVIFMMDVEQDGTVSFDVLNWRNGLQGRIRTGIPAPQDNYNLNIMGDWLTLWVHHADRGRVYSYPMSIIDHCLHPDIEVYNAPLMEPIYLNLKDSTTEFKDKSYEYLFMQRARMWESIRGEPLTHREMFVTQYWRSTEDESSTGSQVRLAIANYRLPIPVGSKAMVRTWITERDIGVCNPPSGEPYPFLDFNHKHGVWLEILPDGRKCVKLCSLPLEHERLEKPEYFDRLHIKTFPVPSVFDLNDLQKMSMDEPSGVLGLTFSDGRLWLLYYDGYDDDRFNIETDMLELMFPDHTGEISLNRDDSSMKE